MKIKLINGLVLIDILTLILVIAVIFIPSGTIRTILGIPFVFFFPGYALTEALFSGRQRIGTIERIALSFGLSIAVTALLGLILNYTPWGIKLTPVLLADMVFILVMSGIALSRWALNSSENPLMFEARLRLPGWSGGPLSKILTLILMLAVIAVVVTIGLAINMPKNGEKFSEFYLLGANSKADDYPTIFMFYKGQVTTVSYDGGENWFEGQLGQITVGIVNQEKKDMKYTLQLQIDGQPVNLEYGGKTLSQIDQIELRDGEKWEKAIGFAPVHEGESQKAEFLLFEAGSAVPIQKLQIWVNARTNN